MRDLGSGSASHAPMVNRARRIVPCPCPMTSRERLQLHGRLRTHEAHAHAHSRKALISCHLDYHTRASSAPGMFSYAVLHVASLSDAPKRLGLRPMGILARPSS